MNKLTTLLKKMPQLGASDLHISAGMEVMARINGHLKALKTPKLTPEQTEGMLMEVLSEEQQTLFKDAWDIDFCLDIPDVGRFRANVLKQRQGIDGVFRFIPTEVPSLNSLGLSNAALDMMNHHQGLIVVAGQTRSGKSTTLAAMVQHMNERRPCHVITIEDPIEYVLPKGKALINQREVGTHTLSTAAALRAALREDPDIIIIGEMRDLETMQLAISASETGHLVVTTLQTQSAQQTIDRLIESFPASQVAQIRTMVAEAVKGVLCQKLLRKADHKGMVLAVEVLTASTSLANLIRDGKTFQIPSLMQTGKTTGMIRMDDSIYELAKKKIIDRQEAIRCANNRKYMGEILSGRKRGDA